MLAGKGRKWGDRCIKTPENKAFAMVQVTWKQPRRREDQWAANAGQSCGGFELFQAGVPYSMRRISVGSVRNARSTAGSVAMSAVSKMAQAGKATISPSVALTL